MSNAAFSRRPRGGSRQKTAAQIACVRCGESKARDLFVNDRTRSNGKFPWCKPCVMADRADTKARLAAQPLQPALEGMEDFAKRCPGCLKSLGNVHTGRVFCGDSCKGKVRQWRVYGLEPDEYRHLIASNDGKCPICQKNVKRWVIDHNHKTGETTGATCSICNTQLLAYSYHDAEVAQRLADYIKSPPVPAMFGDRRYVGPENVSQLHRMWGWSKTHEREAVA